ncbi:MAG: VanZ family protein [Vicinamibacterales bacterium]
MIAAVSRVYLLAALAFTGVALLGSLFPFDFHRVPLSDALAVFSEAGRVDPSRLSLTDAVSNFLLFVPIGLFATGALERTRPGRSGAVLVIVAATLVSVVLELGQAFVSWRTPSSLDVVAEAAGAAAGLVLWPGGAARR